MAVYERTFAVLGLSQFGYRIALTLSQMGADVIAVDRDERIVQRIADDVLKAVAADATDWDSLAHIGVFAVHTVIIGFRRAFDTAVLLVNHLKRHTDVKRIVAQVDTEEKEEVLKELGVDIVVFPERDRADRLARQLTMPNLADHIPLSPNAAIVEVPCPNDFVGKSPIELKIRSVYNVYVIGIRRTKENQESVLVAPPPDTKFQQGDLLILLGTTDNLQEFTRSISATQNAF